MHQIGSVLTGNGRKENNMSNARTKLVCNLNMDDFFTLPDNGEAWRRKGTDYIYITDATGEHVKRYKAYECVSLYDSSQEITLKGTDRVQLVDE